MIRRWLFFDIEITGHHSEYISHLVDYIISHKCPEIYIFVVHPEFSKEFYEIVNKANSTANISFIEISYLELEKINTGGLLKRSINNYRLMNKYALAYSITNSFLLYFNTFQFALGIYRPKYEINGILFFQFSRMRRIVFKEKLKYIQKYLQTWFFVRNKQIKCVYVLNDTTSAINLNKEFKTSIFQMLPDPVPILLPMPNFSVRETYNIDSHRKILIHFGDLSERKGTFNILESFNHLEINNIYNIALILIGKAAPKVDDIIKEKIKAIKKKYNEALIVYKNEFVPNVMMKSFFDQCEIVLIPYKNGEASSGIMGHAIAAGKPVIGINAGLMGEIITKNKLGILIENSSPKSIASGIQVFLNNQIKSYKNSIYLIEHSKEMFASIILL